MNDRIVTSTDSTQRFEIISTAERLAAIGPDWDALWHNVDGFIFQSHAWICAWWSTVPDRKERSLRIGVAWSGSKLAAVMPLAICRRKGVRILEWAAAAHTDYGDILVAPHCREDTLHRLWDEVVRSGRFDVAFLNRLLPDAFSHRLPTGRTKSRLALQSNRRQEVSYRVNGSWPDGSKWFDGQSKKARKNYRRCVKLINETGMVQFRLLAPDEPLGPVLERLATLKRKWLSDQFLQSDLFAEGSDLLARFVDAMARAGILRIFVLEREGVIIAVSINFIQRNTMMAFVTTYDPEAERASPGTLLMTDYIRWSIDQGLTEVDFLCGAEAFKQRFATRSVVLTSLAGAATIKGKAALLVDRGRDALKAMQARRQAKAAPSTPADTDDD